MRPSVIIKLCRLRACSKTRSFDDWRMAYEALPKGLLNELAENMAVYSLELDPREPLGAGESFGAKLNGMFMDAMAAE